MNRPGLARAALASASVGLGLLWYISIFTSAFEQRLGAVLLVFAGLFLAVGLAQFILGIRTDAGEGRIFLLVNGIAAVGIPLSVVLHNLIGALTGGRVEEPVFFLLGALILPLAA